MLRFSPNLCLGTMWPNLLMWMCHVSFNYLLTPNFVDHCMYGKCGSCGFHCETRNTRQRRYFDFIFPFLFINLYWSYRLFWWKCFLACEFWCEYMWPIFGLGFGNVHSRGHAFKFESILGSKLWNYNQLFQSNVCYTTFIKQIEVFRKFKMFLVFPSHLRQYYPSIHAPFVFQLAIMDKCKAWITSMMVMLGAKWRPPT